MTKANISWITENLATGGDFSFNPDLAAEQMLELLDHELDLVIDCRAEEDDTLLWDYTDVTYLYLPTNDEHDFHIPVEHFDKAVEAALPVLEGGGKVFAHCHMGVNRGPSTAFAIMLAQGMSAPKAFDLIRLNRPQAGIYFAEDALHAHMLRKNISHGSREYNRRMSALRHHIRKVMSPEVRKAIQHVIRNGHATDKAERQGGR